ncbi:homeobox-containing protein 1-like [Notothenia coriiceps]|uniref:Homeobox-containing protein 1-like n=1 Tax=Notothenia coriiceps TaxID=8208 RepID=A0A6I9NWM1_9TELE|nr:PREDICTED: homeobox-containing protein 1-like [Notothenia coriiceps]
MHFLKRMCCSSSVKTANSLIIIPRLQVAKTHHRLHVPGADCGGTLSCNTTPPTGATLNMRPAPLPLEDMEWRQTPPPISTAPGTFRLRRGSRFTWRKECLAVMESYFNDNQYPDEAKREEIANACNAVIQKPGKAP